MKATKTLALLPLAALLISPAMAKHNINLSGRVDYTSSDTESTGAKSQAFEMNSARAGFSGDINKDTVYNFEIEASAAAGTQDAISKDTSLINTLNFTTSHSDSLSSTIGKQLLIHGGFEYDYDSRDIYQYSLVGNNLDVYALGLSTNYEVMGQSFQFQIANADKPSDGQRNLRYALGWNGKISMLEVIASYMVTPKAAKDSDKYMTIGAKLDMETWFVEADYLTITNEHAAPVKDDTKTSIVAKAGMNFGSSKAFIKLFMDENETAGTKDYERTGYVAALECYNENHEGLRYHIAYSGIDKDYVSAATTDTRDSKITVGMKFDFDMM